jgi:Spy/CpxP family protein refolding chaperone
MKKHLALFTVAFAVVLMASTAIAQDTTSGATPTATTKKAKSGGKKSSSSRVDTELADMTKQLNLTDDQQAKIKPILADESAQIHKAKKATTGTASDEKAASKKIRDDAKAQILAVLTPDQQKIYSVSSKTDKSADSSTKKHGGKKAAAAAPAAAPTN